MITGFIIARFIAPDDLGLWTTINLAVSYSIFLQAGLINGLNLELPFTLGKGDDEEAFKMTGSVQTFTIFSSAFILLTGLICFGFLPIHDSKIRYGILAITFFIMLTYYQNYLMSTFRSKNSFLKLAAIQLVDAFVNLSTLILIVYFSYYGMIIKAVLVVLIYVTLLHINRPIKVGFLWDKAVLLKLLKVGLPIFALSYLESVASTADKLWVLKYAGLTEVGLYSFGFYAFSLFTLFSTSVASYIYPRMTYSYGKNNDKTVLWHYVKRITVMLFIVQIPLVILGYNLIPYLVSAFFPKYVLSITIMKILLLAGAFKGCVIGVNALWSMKKWNYMIFYQVLFSVLLVCFPLLGIRLLPNILEGVAYGVLLATIVNFFTGISLTYLATHKEQ